MLQNVYKGDIKKNRKNTQNTETLKTCCLESYKENADSYKSVLNKIMATYK